MTLSKPMVGLTMDLWEEKFKPIKNTFDDNASFDGIMFETYGEELDFVRSHYTDHIWTYVDGDGGTYIINGYHLVNRIGYFVTEEQYDKSLDYEIQVSADDNNQKEDDWWFAIK